MNGHGLLRISAFSLSLAACSESTDRAIAYPPLVKTAADRQLYKTALWWTYTAYLDSAALRRSSNPDSLSSTFRGLLRAPRRLRSMSQRGRTTCFRFELHNGDGRSRETLVRLWDNCFKYAPATGLNVPVGVWVDRTDGLVDTVLTYNNILRDPALPGAEEATFNKGRTVGQRRYFGPLDASYKVAFLRANQHHLPQELKQLCLEKGIFH